jgi:hypothetical protein
VSHGGGTFSAKKQHPVVASIRALRRGIDKRTGVPYITTIIRIHGARQIEVFDRLCEATSRQPSELASDIVVEELWSLMDGKARKLTQEQRRWRKGRFRGPGG